MDDYKKDIEEIKELLKKIQKEIAQLEIKIEADQFIDYWTNQVPSTQACKGE